MKKRDIKSLIWGSLLLICFLTLLLFLKLKDKDILSSLGTTGDFIGGFLGTIVSIFATYLIFITYSSQKKELKLQRDLFAQQQFETTFFNMINVHSELKKNLRLNLKSKICNIEDYEEKNEDNSYSVSTYKKVIVTDYVGVDVFKLIRLDLEILINDIIEYDVKTFGFRIIKDEIRKSILKVKDQIEKEKVIKVYEEVSQNYKSILYHYCRNSYHILKFIRRNELEHNKNLKSYADIFQSQLNSDELTILLYNFIWFSKNDQDDEFQPKELVKHFDLFQNADLKFFNHKNFL